MDEHEELNQYIDIALPLFTDLREALGEFCMAMDLTCDALRKIRKEHAKPPVSKPVKPV